MIVPMEIVALQNNQSNLRDEMYRSLHEDPVRAPEVKTQYEKSVQELIEKMGANAACWSVDCDLWSFFSDYYKDVNGFRPKMHMTRDEVLAWIDRENENPTPWEE